MFDQEEKQLFAHGAKLNNISTPEVIDDYIRAGIQMGQMKKKKNRSKIFSATAIAAAILITLFVSTVRISPAFASAASKIPGLEYIVKMINYDRGITDAIDHNFVQPINSSDEHEGLKLTMKDMICDTSKIILFYSLENKGNHRVVELSKMTFQDEHGNPIPATIAWSYNGEIDMNKTRKFENKIELILPDHVKVPKKLYITAKLKEMPPYDSIVRNTNENEPSTDLREKNSVVLASTWKFQITIDQQKFQNMKMVYQMNRIAEIGGQKLLFKTVTITPTQAIVDVEYDKSNSKRILYFDDDVFIVDEKNNKWGKIMNGVAGSRMNDFHETIFFQSNYFQNPKELYLVGNSVRAVDVDKRIVEIDVAKKSLMNAPDHLKLKSLKQVDNRLYFQFTFKTDIIKDASRGYWLFNDIVDESGRFFEKYAGSSHAGELNGIGYNEFYIENADKIKGNLYLTIGDFPERITEAFKVRIK